MRQITVLVPDRRVEEFYIRFGEFLVQKPSSDEPALLASGTVPGWAVADDAPAIALRFWRELSLPGAAMLRYLMRAAKSETAVLTADELAEMSGHPKKASGVAGTLGGIGRAVRRADLPLYKTPRGADWHYVWWWDGERYSMTPEVAKLLRDAEEAASHLPA